MLEMDLEARVAELEAELASLRAQIKCSGLLFEHEAVRINEERFRLAMKAVHGLVYEVDLRTGVVQRSDGFEALTGIADSNAEASDRWWRSRVHPDDQRVLDEVDRYLQEPERSEYEVEYRIRQADGNWIDICDRAYIARGARGEALRLYGSTYDATQRKRLEADLQSSNRQLKFQADILSAITDIVLAVDRDLKITYVNAAAERMYSVSGADVMGKPLRVMYERVWSAPDGEDRLWQSLRQRGMWHGEVVHACKNGKRFTSESSVASIAPELGGGYMAVIRDVSERKRAEKELAENAERLRRANEDLLHFAYAVSHDLQTPLRTVNSFANLLQRQCADQLDQESQEYLSLIRDGSARMSAMLRDLVRFAQFAGAPVDFNAKISLRRAVERAIYNLRSGIDETGAEVIIGDLPVAKGDLSQFTQLFQNLIGNALKYRKPGGAPVVTISAEQTADEWVIRVKDNGIGFEPKFADRIFRVFERLHRDEASGSGIGLAICKRIVDRCGGRIWANGLPGEGAEFLFSIPVEASTPTQ